MLSICNKSCRYCVVSESSDSGICAKWSGAVSRERWPKCYLLNIENVTGNVETYLGGSSEGFICEEVFWHRWQTYCLKPAQWFPFRV